MAPPRAAGPRPGSRVPPGDGAGSRCFPGKRSEGTGWALSKVIEKGTFAAPGGGCGFQRKSSSCFTTGALPAVASASHATRNASGNGAGRVKP